MKLQNFQAKDLEVKKKFIEYRRNKDLLNSKRLSLSWSNWGFGTEPLEVSAARLEKNNIQYIELHGNKYGNDLGYDAKETKTILDSNNIRVAGICGMVFPESEFASNNPFVRQMCIDYFRRNTDLCNEVGGSYILFAPGAVGRPKKYDDNEFFRAAETINKVADYFVQNKVRGAVEPVRPEEVSFCHTFAEAKRLIDAIDHPGVKHIAGDVFHMISGEEHIASTILEYGDMMINLHLADTNRRALGTGSLDLDLILMALYIVGYNNDSCFCSPEPLGAGSDPYSVMYGSPDPKVLDELVRQTASYFYKREEEILSASDSEISST
ncbi:MAG: sugar phosphate isomerase/epimerase [Actinobacteria bacterium]|nr:sugar phosphate isomerase/epimerase [Actinomycetota bacterium]